MRARELIPGCLRALFFSLLLSSAGLTWAALGREPTAFPVSAGKITAPAAKKSSTPAPDRANSYRVHESQLENGTLIREYASLAGVVFAITWRGPVLPDLSLLLGRYFGDFKLAAEQARSTGRRGASFKMEGDALVVRSSGRMRNFFGYAYAPELIPSDVNIKDVLQ